MKISSLYGPPSFVQTNSKTAGQYHVLTQNKRIQIIYCIKYIYIYSKKVLLARVAVNTTNSLINANDSQHNNNNNNNILKIMISLLRNLENKYNNKTITRSHIQQQSKAKLITNDTLKSFFPKKLST